MLTFIYQLGSLFIRLTGHVGWGHIFFSVWVGFTVHNKSIDFVHTLSVDGGKLLGQKCITHISKVSNIS